jgi:hypothetical protein
MSKRASAMQLGIYTDLRTQFKKIETYTDEELEATIAVLGDSLPEVFKYLNFIDAYFERRKRRELEAAK